MPRKGNCDYIELSLVTPLLRKFAYVFVVLVASTYAIFALKGPQGLPALMEKWAEVRALEQENAALQQQIREKRDRIDRLRKRPDELELEIRRETMQVKPGEKVLILPEAENTGPESENAGPEAQTPGPDGQASGPDLNRSKPNGTGSATSPE